MLMEVYDHARARQLEQTPFGDMTEAEMDEMAGHYDDYIDFLGEHPEMRTISDVDAYFGVDATGQPTTNTEKP